MCAYKKTTLYPSGNPNGSVAFSDDLTELCELVEVRIEAVQWVAYIQGVWRDVDGKEREGAMHGHTHGDQAVSFRLEEGEWISQVDGWYGKYIDYLKFTTNKGNYKEWGTPGGEGNTAFSVEGRINGFYGFAEGSLDGIGFFHPYQCASLEEAGRG
jgi:hypothetical protein